MDFHKAILIVPMTVLLALEVYHCARRNGWRFSATFFGAAVLFGVIRANVLRMVLWTGDTPLPYAMSGTVAKLGFASLAESLGWAFALYGSWFLSEGMLRRTRRWSSQIFPVVFLSALMMGGFSYAVEAAATPMGWWHWRVALTGSPFVFAVPLLGVFDWANVSIDFLLPFFLIECSAFRRSAWRYLAISIFAVHMLVHAFPFQLYGAGRLFDLWHWGAIWLAGLLGLLWDLRFEPASAGGDPVSLRGKEGGWKLDWIPATAVAVMLVIVLYAAMVVARDARLLYSILPLAAALLITCAGAPAWLLSILAAAGCTFSLYFVPALLPAGSLWMYSLRTLQKTTRAAKTAVCLAAGAGILLYVPWALDMSRRTELVKENLLGVIRALDRGDHAEAIRLSKEGYRFTAKYTAGHEILLQMTRSAWAVRDRESFDSAQEELSSFHPKYRALALTWDIASEDEFDKEFKKVTGRTR